MNLVRLKNLDMNLRKDTSVSLFKITWKENFYKASIISLGLVFIFLIILLKSKTTVEFAVEPYFFSYAIFVTAFILSRLIAAMMYKNSYASLIKEGEIFHQYKLEYEPRIAFIIPCKNEEKNIINTIVQCYRAQYPVHKMEVLVINDGSTDNTISVLRNLQKNYPNLKIIDWKNNQGKRKAMAEGFLKTNAEIIIQLDSDSYIDPSTIRHLIEPFKNNKVAAVCASGQPTNAQENLITKMQTAYYFMSFRILKSAESTYDTVFCCSGCCSAYRKESVMPILEKWSGEKFLGRAVTWGDDRSLTSWILRRGGKTIFNDKAIAYTVVPNNLRTLLVQQLRWKKSWIVNFFITSKFILKKQPFVTLFYYFPLVFISFITPIMTFRALIFMPLTKGVLPFYHIAGIILLTALIAMYYRLLDKNNKFWPYLFLWSLFNLFILSFMIVWAVFKIQDRGWGTR